MTNKITFDDVKQKMMDECATYMSIMKRDYPRIHAQILEGWGTRELHNKFIHMLVTDASGRKGFPGPAGFALMRLHTAHQLIFDFEEFKLAEPNAFNGTTKDTW